MSPTGKLTLFGNMDFPIEELIDGGDMKLVDLDT
jgi:hypothetical protein